ncbi:MAG TPA: RsmE family RNA methyltransferase [Candidatus Binataceae bacterium]|nr:RsmE family RNA methyltransferase [Candidatus Binataceae bacterium]HVB80021.1 RsmE family RNA methyltransferase [Candidatus Binataceae bacterium]
MKVAPRFLADQPLDRGAPARVSGAELHHLRDLMRLEAGDAVTLIDPTGGGEFAGHIRSVARDCAIIELGMPMVAPTRTPLVLAMALIKGPRMDFIVEKAVELGATELWPIVAARSQMATVGVERRRRWNRLAAAAAKQSLASKLPSIRAPLEFSELVSAPYPDTLALICVPGATPIARVLDDHRPARLMLVCGPEGGFDRSELAAAERAGFVAAGLGRSRLRSETAALAALAVAAAALDAEGS